MRRSCAELFARELALTLSTEGERLHASIFSGAELPEGHASLPLSLELVALLDAYQRSPSDALPRLEGRIRAISDSIVRAMRGDRVARTLTGLFVQQQHAALNYYVNWRAVVLKIHALLLQVEGLDEILELHRPGSKVRKQLALPAHPTRDLLRSKELLPGSVAPGGSGKRNPAAPVFHQPRAHPIRATGSTATARKKATELERKASLLLRSREGLGAAGPFDSSLRAPKRGVSEPMVAEAAPLQQQQPPPRDRAGSDAAISSLPSVPSPIRRPPSGGDLLLEALLQQEQPTIAPSPSSSAGAGVVPSPAAASASSQRPVVPSSLRAAAALRLSTDALDEMSSSLPGRYSESAFLGAAGPIPPSRLSESIELRDRRRQLPADGDASQQQQQQQTPTAPAGDAPPADAPVVAPPFRTTSASLEQLVVVQPLNRFAPLDDDESHAPPRAALGMQDPVTGEWEQAPDWMRFIVHWNGTSAVAGPSADPRGVRIPLPFLLMGVQAHGAYDHALVGVLCLALWKAAGSPKLTLGPYLPPGFLDRNGIHMQNRALNTLERELQRLAKGPVSQVKLRSLQKHLILPAATSDRRAVLAKLSSNVYFAARANLVQSLEAFERLCIGLLGNDDEATRDTAVRLLNGILDGHDWQRQEAFEPVVRSVGDAFVVELDANELSVPPSSVLLQVCMPPHAGAGQRVFFSVRPRLVSGASQDGAAPATASRKSSASASGGGGGGDRLLVDWLPPLSRCGFVDWRFVHLDEAGLVTPLVSQHACAGRVIVQPRVRLEALHEFTASAALPFSAIAARLRELQRGGVTIVYVSGACAGPSVNELTDRAVPNAAAGGAAGFAELLAEAKRCGVGVVVDVDHMVSAASHARRYEPLLAQRMDPSRRFRVPQEGHDGLHMPFPRCALLNYRRKETWDELTSDVLSWCARGCVGVRLAASHCAPLILRTDAAEMGRLDPNGQPHYDVAEIFEGAVSLPPTNEAVTFGYFGTDGLYANPLLVKLAMAAWQQYPDCRLFAESYWRRAGNALAGGFIPQAAELTEALCAVFGVSVTPDMRRLPLPERASVKGLYAWFREERAAYPPNATLVHASSHHFLPYPVLLHGRGAWAAVDLLYFGPDVPGTFSNEMLGEARWGGPSGAALAAAGAVGTALDIAGHYQHRARLRATYRVLREGGFLPLLTFWGDSQRSWHDRVFAFARFTADKMCICAINFNDVESTVYVDLSPLAELVSQGDRSIVFKVLDLIDPSSPPQFFAPSEFLADRHFHTLPAYGSLLLGLFVETVSASTERTLFEQSFRRLLDKLVRRQDCSANFLFRELSASFASLEQFEACLSRVVRVLKPDVRSPFGEDMRRMLYFLTRDSRQREALLLSFLTQLRDGAVAGSAVRDWCRSILEANAIGPIVFVTPEMGRFSTVGGIGVMVSELTRSLAELGLDVRVISPYYNFDKKGATGYLEKEGISWQQNITTSAGHEFVECGLHTGEEVGVKLYFLHHWRYFSTPYQSGSPAEQLQALVVFAKASLELLCQLHVIPSIVVTNDWFTGLLPAYARHTGSFGSSFAGTTFFHLVHNLEEGYEGKIYVDGDDDLGHVHQMRREFIVDSFDGRVTVLNSSKCALLSCNQWGTVSRSYRDDLLRVSPLAHLLRRFDAPFAHLNGIRTADRLEVLSRVGATDHAEAKRRVQEKYFGGKADERVALFAFVGRIVLQKGVHLILECAHALLSAARDSSEPCPVQIMVAGPANKKDPYAASCAWKMAALRTQFPGNFWADPEQFFLDGTLVNVGADFGLVPSLFEPSGIVQQEFFSGGTPVVAFKTGGLKDTVFEYDRATGQGNGLTFEAHHFDDLMVAMQRSLRVFRQPEHYAKLRANARKSVLDNSVVADAWSREFCRLKQRLWASPDAPSSSK